MASLSAEVEEIRRARAVAALIVHPHTSLAIDQLDATWRSLRDIQGDDQNVLRQRVEALRSTYEAVLQMARRDLGL